MKHLLLCIAGLLTLLSCEKIEDALPKTEELTSAEIQKINHMLVFDFYLNFEFANNADFSTIVDVIPDEMGTPYKKVTLATNIGKQDRFFEFSYTEGKLRTAYYEAADLYTQFDIDYTANNVVSMDINSTPKVKLEYDDKGYLAKIIRTKSAGTVEMSFSYDIKQKQVTIKQVQIVGDKRQQSATDYTVVWNSIFKKESYNMYIYIGNSYKYSDLGYCTSFVYHHVDGESPVVYTHSEFDSKKNWLVRKAEDITDTRTVTYQE